MSKIVSLQQPSLVEAFLDNQWLHLISKLFFSNEMYIRSFVQQKTVKILKSDSVRKLVAKFNF